MVKQQPFYANKNGVKCSRTSSRLEIRQLNYTDIEKDGEPFQIYTTTGIFLLHMSGGGQKKLANFLINFFAISCDSKHFSGLFIQKT